MIHTNTTSLTWSVFLKIHSTKWYVFFKIELALCLIGGFLHYVKELGIDATCVHWSLVSAAPFYIAILIALFWWIWSWVWHLTISLMCWQDFLLNNEHTPVFLLTKVLLQTILSCLLLKKQSCKIRGVWFNVNLKPWCISNLQWMICLMSC